VNSNPSFHAIFRKRWAVPVLAQLAVTRGSKMVTLASHLGGSRASIRSSIELLESLRLVQPNPGYGHPMRPEYILTERGVLVSKPSMVLIKTLRTLETTDLGLKRWSMPAMHAIASGADRFNGIAGVLQGATDRAVSLALHDLHGASLIVRTLRDGRPPHKVYTLARPAGRITPVLADLSDALG